MTHTTFPVKTMLKQFGIAVVAFSCLTAFQVSSADAQNSGDETDGATPKAFPDLGELPPAPGLIFDIEANTYIMFDDMVSRLSGRKYVLIGEQHDNPVHHHHQAHLVSALSQRDGHHRAVVWEMLTRDQQTLLNQKWQDVTIDELGPALTWSERGWPSWHDYAPIAEAARERDLPMIAGNLPDNLLRPMISDGLSVLPAGLADKLALPDMPENIKTRLAREIAEGHCNKLPETMVPAFAKVQFARDASLARAMFDATRADDVDGAFLIAGAMHVRHGIAAPWHLARFDAEVTERDIAVVALIEADDPSDNSPLAKDYALRLGGKETVDFLWFTNDIIRDDPCQSLKMDR